MTLAEEAQQYLAVVEFFRREGCEPRWQPEAQLERTQLTHSSSTDSVSLAEGRKR